ncbi:pyridoxamine 5'-phosphate oxidase [Gallaecimonas kandeliae]|uniref:pyridoxamine 5'-phosphate oxidase n=1 Tax=Gallaecimonas kandeliae TaxID=3029055 RepID=UPI00264A4E53|nr:pyridoxamine 5'-phosphate oxidase [Gallaecimonas kandeliae]WKE66866.1 pyridoxamine 5'-phosphate oxidase [Gallaecimonas kandeliae]
MSIDAMRRVFRHAPLTQLDADPLHQFDQWFREARDASPVDWLEVNAMTLSTLGLDGFPKARIVLLKGLDERGFQFFTNYDSDKGKELAANPNASLNFYWPHLARQVRVEGRVEKVSREESEAYFASRPRGSQLGAWASAQSEAIDTPAVLDGQLEAAEARFPGTVPCPPHWGGYLLVPQRIEFWAGRENRLHHRVRYERAEKGWQHQWLSP